MPPPLEELSDADSSGGSIPFNSNVQKEQREFEDTAEAQDGPDEDEGDDDEEGVYVVERILGHAFHKNTLLLRVKWKGYDDPADQTMEPEENLIEGAKDTIEDYYQSIGGRPQKPAAAPKKRKSAGPAKTPAKKSAPKRQRKSESAAADDVPADDEDNLEQPDMPEWVPKGDSWEDHVEKVDTVLRGDGGTLCAFLHWKNGRKLRVSVDTCYDKCPKKMLKFYESHLVFRND